MNCRPMTYGSLLPVSAQATRSRHLYSKIPSDIRTDSKEHKAIKFRQIIVLALCVSAITAVVGSKNYNGLSKSLPGAWESEAVAFSNQDSSYRNLFEEFKIAHNRNYESVSEEDSRFNAFKASIDIIEKLEASNPLATFSINQYADRTANEILTRRMNADYSEYPNLIASLPSELVESAFEASSGHKNKGIKSKTIGKDISKSQFGWITEDDCAACKLFPELDSYNLSNMPTEWDWRTKYETPVRDQGYCGSCWSFSTAGDIEGSWFLATGNVIELSKQQLVSCDQKRGAAEGCNGGFPNAAIQYVSQIGGLVYETAYPYQPICTRDCPISAYLPPVCDIDTITESLKSNNVAHVGGWQMVALGPDFEELLAVALVKNGPISIALNAETMEYYSKGILESTTQCNPAMLNHAVLLVGFGTENGVPYWIIKNSWGTEWGEGGYVRVVRGINYCGLANFAVTSVVKAP